MSEVESLVNLTIVPWGNAQAKGAVWQCQHGPGECMGNTIESCVFHLYPDQKQNWPFALCYEGLAHTCSRTAWGTCPSDTARTCATTHGLDWSLIAGCFGNLDPKTGMPPTNSLGFKLGSAAQARTSGLSPAHTGVPWLTMNGAHVADSVLKWPALTCEICAQSTITPKPLICDVIKPVCPTLPPLPPPSPPGPPPAPPGPAVDCNDNYKTKATCDGNAACSWCTSAAVPAACNTLKDAKGLPPSVFKCDKI